MADQDQDQAQPQAQAQAQAQAQDRRNKGVFWDLGLAVKESDPTDPTGKKMRAVCKCLNDRDNPDSFCNKQIGKLHVISVIFEFLVILFVIFCFIRMLDNNTCQFRIIQILNVISVFQP